MVETLSATVPQNPHLVIVSKPGTKRSPTRPRRRFTELTMFIVAAGGIGWRSWTPA